MLQPLVRPAAFACVFALFQSSAFAQIPPDQYVTSAGNTYTVRIAKDADVAGY